MSRVSDGTLRLVNASDNVTLELSKAMARELRLLREVAEALKNTNVHIGTDGPLMDALAALDAEEDGE